jgi:hypothetical protein
MSKPFCVNILLIHVSVDLVISDQALHVHAKGHHMQAHTLFLVLPVCLPSCHMLL